jgi:SAM-dependent MidA family methyltransferase
MALSGLAARLRERIARDGPLPLDAYIAACLADADAGYYRRQAAIGAEGDFITAPEISQIFGELIGLWAAAVWQQLGRPDPVQLVELGPGRGTLAADALRAIAATMPALAAALRLTLVETSPRLCAVQAEALAGRRLAAAPVWRERFADVAAGPLILIANEFFDALPMRQFVRVASGWRERRIGLAPGGDRFAFVLAEAAAPALLPTALADAAEGDVVEIAPEADALAAAIGRRIVAAGGAALIIDYGHTRPAFGDTLQAVARHRYADPLAAPGEADLSHHVDFAALAAAARAAGAAAWGPIPQGLFLARLGILGRAEALARASPERADEIEGALRRLVHPRRMGDLFKALALAAPGLPPPPGF